MNLPAGPILNEEELAKIFLTNPYPYLDQWRHEYGDIFTLNIGTFGLPNTPANGKWVMIGNPKLLQDLFTSDGTDLHAGEANLIQFAYGILPRSILALDEDDYRLRRKIVAKPFTNINSHAALMRDNALSTIDEFPQSDHFELYQYLRDISYKTIISEAFGLKASDELESVCKSVMKIEMRETTDLERAEIMGDLKSLIDKKIEAEIEHIKKQSNAEIDPKASLFSSLIRSFQDNSDVLPINDMTEEIIMLMIGGVATTSSMLTWSLSWILSNENVLNSIKTELTTSLPEGVVTSDNVDNLPYLDQVIMESLRISPLLWSAGLRLVKKQYQLGEYTFSPGTILANCPYLLHRNEALYKDATKFIPERFDNFKPSIYEWTPFGGGMRLCVGKAFAMLQIKVVIATLLKNCNFELIDYSLEPECKGIFFIPSSGLKVKLN